MMLACFALAMLALPSVRAMDDCHTRQPTQISQHNTGTTEQSETGQSESSKESTVLSWGLESTAKTGSESTLDWGLGSDLESKNKTESKQLARFKQIFAEIQTQPSLKTDKPSTESPWDKANFMRNLNNKDEPRSKTLPIQEGALVVYKNKEYIVVGCKGAGLIYEYDVEHIKSKEAVVKMLNFPNKEKIEDIMFGGKIETTLPVEKAYLMHPNEKNIFDEANKQRNTIHYDGKLVGQYLSLYLGCKVLLQQDSFEDVWTIIACFKEQEMIRQPSGILAPEDVYIYRVVNDESGDTIKVKITYPVPAYTSHGKFKHEAYTKVGKITWT